MQDKVLTPDQDSEIKKAYKAIVAVKGTVSIDTVNSPSSDNVVTAISNIKDNFGSVRSNIIIDKLIKCGEQALKGKVFHVDINTQTGSMSVK